MLAKKKEKKNEVKMKYWQTGKQNSRKISDNNDGNSPPTPLLQKATHTHTHTLIYGHTGTSEHTDTDEHSTYRNC